MTQPCDPTDLTWPHTVQRILEFRSEIAQGDCPHVSPGGCGWIDRTTSCKIRKLLARVQAAQYVYRLRFSSDGDQMNSETVHLLCLDSHADKDP